MPIARYGLIFDRRPSSVKQLPRPSDLLLDLLAPQRLRTRCGRADVGLRKQCVDQAEVAVAPHPVPVLLSKLAHNVHVHARKSDTARGLRR
jgi:hypothetical protein